MENNSLYHHGIKGMRWGVRRFQRKDGTLTRAGKKRYASDTNNPIKSKLDEASKSIAKAKAAQQEKAKAKVEQKPKELTPEEKKAKILYSRSAKTLYENRQLFDYNEMEKQRQLLELDGKVKAMIVEEPSKVEKFLTKAASFATKVKDVAVPAIDTITKFTDMMEKLDPEAKARKAAKEQAEVDAKRNEARLKKLSGDKTQAETNTENEKTGKAKAEREKAEFELNKMRKEAENTPDPDPTPNQGGNMKWRKKPSGIKGTVLGKEDSSDSTNTNSTSDKKRTIWDVDFEDVTPSRSTVSFVSGVLNATSSAASLASKTVNSLPAPSASTTNTIAGLLPPPSGGV